MCFYILNFVRVFRLFFIAQFAGIMPLYLKIATINCRGLRDPAKRLTLYAYARKLDVQVLCLQETYSQPQDEQKWQNEWGDKNQAVFNSNSEINRKTDAGTAVLLNDPLIKFGIIRKDSGGRILAAEIRCDSFGFQVVNIMPSRPLTQSKKGKVCLIKFMTSLMSIRP